MAIPKFEDFLYPFISFIRDNELSKKELKLKLIEHFGLTDEDCLLKTKGGTVFQLDDRIGWCKQWLQRALFIDSPQRGVYRITQRGKDYLKSHSDLRREELMQYPEFVEYSGGGTNKQSEVNLVENDEILTPSEQMEVAFKTINDDLAADLIQKVLDMSPSFFENLVLDLLLNMGFGSKNRDLAVVTPTSHDNGVDGIIPEDPLGLDKIYIQAKRYTDNTVQKPDIQKFIGALDEQKATKGVFITTSKFSPGAKETAEKASKKIVLIDGKTLADYMIEYNVGVSVKMVYEIKRLDSDYFDE